MSKITAWIRAQSKMTLVTLSIITVLNIMLLGLSIYYCTIFSETVRSLRADHTVSSDYDATIISTTSAIDMHPSDEMAYHRRARLYMREEKYDKALDDLSKVIQINPNNIDAYIDRAFLYDQLKTPEAAKADRAKVKELYARSPR